jgi:hypothetical protein
MSLRDNGTHRRQLRMLSSMRKSVAYAAAEWSSANDGAVRFGECLLWRGRSKRR